MVRDSSGTIGRLSEAFDAAWLAGHRPSIDEYLSQAGSDCRRDLLRVLVACELKHRSGEDPAPTWAEYQTRFPELLADNEESAFETLDGVSGLADGTHRNADGSTQVGMARSDAGTTAGLDSGGRPGRPKKPGQPDDSGSTRVPQKSLMPVKIGRYTIIGAIGKGGQGAVYRGAHPTLPVEVAIKVARHRFDSQAQASLRSEATVLCDLDHPNIARVRDLDFDQGRPFVVLDYIRGRSMRERLDSQAVASDEAIGWLVRVADAIDYAHRRGVTHLDLKPDNIVVDEAGCPRVIDFGLARLSQPGQADALDSQRGVSGTLTYMSPEQARAERNLIGPASDVFALGAILYRIGVGTGPYGRGDIRSSMDRIQRGDIDFGPLEASALNSAAQHVAKRALAAEPGERFSTASDFAVALGEANSSTSLALPDATAQGKRSVALTLKFLGITISLAVTAVVLLVGGPAWMAKGPIEVASVESGSKLEPIELEPSQADFTSVPAPTPNAVPEKRLPSRPSFKSIDWMSADRAVVRLRGGGPSAGMRARGLGSDEPAAKTPAVPLQLSVYLDERLFPMAWSADQRGVRVLHGVASQTATENVIYPPLDAAEDDPPLMLERPMLLILQAGEEAFEESSLVTGTVKGLLSPWIDQESSWQELRGEWRYTSGEGSSESKWLEMEGTASPLTESESDRFSENLEELRGILDQIHERLGGDLSALLVTP
ncbi:MAG: serine/threonine-protein kinase [Planctomycetota bacterium]